MQTQPHRIVLRFALVLDAGLDQVGAEHTAFEQELVIVLERGQAFQQAAGRFEDLERSGSRIVCVRAHIGMLEPQNDMLTRNTGLDEFLSYPRFRPITLYPDHVSGQINVNQNAVNASVAISSHFAIMIVAPFVIEN